MTRPLVQSVRFDAPGAELFEAYLDPVQHAQRLGRGAVEVRPKAGEAFRAFDGNLRGTMLTIVPKQLIVQSWRASTEKWQPSDPDSLLILAFSDDAAGGRIDMVQLGVPAAAFEIIDEGWKAHYWKPWGGTIVG
jgi:uncharacterized protein YndB with AHSA1/START domain